MTYRYIYKITCTKGSFKDKFYFGKHTTDNLDDGYKGSGTKLYKYYKKHPNDYIKEIISFHSSEEELNKAEYDIIHPWLNNVMCLNLREGGKGGCFSKESLQKLIGHPCSLDTKNKISQSLKGKTIGRKSPMKGKHLSEESKKKMSDARKGKSPSNKGKHLTEEQKRHVSESRKGKNKGQIPWNKGKKLPKRSEDTKKKISETLKRNHDNS